MYSPTGFSQVSKSNARCTILISMVSLEIVPQSKVLACTWAEWADPLVYVFGDLGLLDWLRLFSQEN